MPPRSRLHPSRRRFLPGIARTHLDLMPQSREGRPQNPPDIARAQDRHFHNRTDFPRTRLSQDERTLRPGLQPTRLDGPRGPGLSRPANVRWWEHEPP